MLRSRYGLVNQTSYFGFVTHVGAYELGLSAEFAEFRDKLLSFLLTSARDNKLRSFLREGQCGSTPDACERACNQNDRGSHDGSPK
jgi:hypothetical protein